jgi:hypothetical protein
MKNYAFAIVVAVACAASACVGFEHKQTVTSPTSADIGALMGTWESSPSDVIPTASTCVDFKWNATTQTSTSAAGSFSATCAGGLKVQGTASGSLTGSTVTWGANGTTTAPGGAACPVTLTGTAELGVNSIRVPYSGNTCLGPVSGVQVLNRK